MLGIYLAAYRANHPKYNIIYQDINGKRDLGGDMMHIDLDLYDFIIATPPCNYWSRANYRRNTSKYAQDTKHLLPAILNKLCRQDKPFIVENVRNEKMFMDAHLFELPCFVYFIGRHTYWTNILLGSGIIQTKDNTKYISSCKRQGGKNVAEIIELFLSTIHNER